MSIIRELIKLHDPMIGIMEADAPVELKAVIDAFPKQHGKALQKLWGGRRLVWHGMKFFDDNELGEAYVKAEGAAEAYINDGYNTDVNMDIQGPDGDVESLSFDAEFGDQEGGERQECYLGYDPKTDKLYIGFDAWTGEENFNEAFDKAFEEAHGTDHDPDDEEHAAVFKEAWDEYQSEGYGFWGIVFEIDRDFTAEEALPPMPGGFYKGTYKLFKQQHPNVVDLRLD